MANLIQIPYKQLNALSSKSTDGLIDKYKKILYKESFQKRVLAIRRHFLRPLHLDTASEKNIERDITLETKSIYQSVEILLRKYHLSDEWVNTLREFVKHNRLVLPSKDIQNYSDMPLKEMPTETIPESDVKVVYDDGKVRILLHSDHLVRGDLVMPNPKILIELHAEAVNEDINAVYKVITKIRGTYQRPLSQHPNKSIPIEVCNAVWMKKRQNDLLEKKDRKKVRDLIEEIKDEFDFPMDRENIRKTMTMKDYERALEVARKEGF